MGADNFGELTVFYLDFFDRGTYECDITNVHASQSCEATLDIQGTYVCTIVDTIELGKDCLLFLLAVYINRLIVCVCVCVCVCVFVCVCVCVCVCVKALLKLAKTFHFQ